MLKENSPYPNELLELSEQLLAIAGVESCGLTMTADKRWALLVILSRAEEEQRAATVATVLRSADSVPIVFEEADEDLTAAPARRTPTRYGS